jgi:CRISPR-associated protein Cas2
MPVNETRGWLVTYDIAHPKRLNRIHRLLVRHAIPIQYSVFCFEGSANQLGRLMKSLEKHIDSATDDVRAYQLPENLSVDLMGKTCLPEDMMLLTRSAALQKLLTVERRFKDSIP